jgi:adenine phosphoribosyltransferase
MSNRQLQQPWRLVRDVPYFPQPGILYRDITPLLADADAFNLSVQPMAEDILRPDAKEFLAI